MSTTTTSQENRTLQQKGKVVYTAKCHTTGGRDGGSSRTSDGRLDVKFSLPGTVSSGTNPEQLFAVGWSACFISAMEIATARMKISLPPDTSIDAEVDLAAGVDGYFLQARLNVYLPGIERDVAQAVVDAAEKLCPYSKATRGNIGVEIKLV
ncbi:MAG: peroxiredoxin, Ohr subfamily [Planctomycetaceae bacterium]|nr:peroxiredoxin, Ohr subfamily [Planctomycetaceae bacterium]